MTGKFKALSTTKKVLFGIGISVLTIGFIGAVNPTPEEKQTKELVESTSQLKDADTDTADEKDKKPIIETKTIEELVAIPYSTTTQNDAALASGTTVTAVAGVNGEKTMIYSVTYTDGIETGRELTGEHIIKQPVTEIKKIGTKVAAAPKPKPTSNCHASYTGACVPANVSDVDCAGGTGNGPYYVGLVQVVGPDVYDLDRDSDGIGCE